MTTTPPPAYSSRPPSPTPSPTPSLLPITSTAPPFNSTVTLKVTKSSIFDGSYTVLKQPHTTSLYTIPIHTPTFFSSKPDLTLRHAVSNFESAAIHLRSGGDIEFIVHGTQYFARKDGVFAVSWTVDRGGEWWTVKHTHSVVEKSSSKHLKLVDVRGEVKARWVSYSGSSMRTLGKLELGEGGEGGEGGEWEEWCLALMVGIAEQEKRDRRTGGGGRR